MSKVSQRGKLFAYPVQLIRISDGVVVKRGCTELKINGPGAKEALGFIFSIAQRYHGASEQDILKLVASPSRSRAKLLINKLVDHRFLVRSQCGPPQMEKRYPHLDVFLWQLGQTACHVIKKLNKTQLFILGVNYISRRFAFALQESGQTNFKVVDHPRLRNHHLFDARGRLKRNEWPAILGQPESWTIKTNLEPGMCLVATSDCGGRTDLREWNQLCFKSNAHFMPIILKDMVGSVGPVVIPGETACYECLLLRYRSHALEQETDAAIDSAAYDGQEMIGFHPSMACIIGDIAALEFMRFYSGLMPGRKLNKLLEIDLLGPSITERMVHKIPTCPTCGPLQTNGRTDLSKFFFSRATT